MCGRYQLDYTIEQLIMRFDARNNYVGYGTKKEVFPTDTVAVLTRKENSNFIEAAKWGFVSPFDKRPLINARGESVDEKRTFKKSFLESRCIIPATAFYEWKTEEKRKIKYTIRPQGSDVFGMAGLYKTDKDDDGKTILRCIVITTSANKAMSEIHERMPVILSKEHEDIWMDPSVKDADLLKQFFNSYSGILSFTPEDKGSQISFC